MDETVWGDPDTFRPERFLGSEADSFPNPLIVVFGYGMRCVLFARAILFSLGICWNRVCPGMYLADRVGFHIGATVAALYDVIPLEGCSRPKLGSIAYTDGVTR